MRPSSTFRPEQLRWLMGFACFLGVAFVGLGVRLFFLQVMRHEEFRALATQRTQESIVREPWRGDILDANGNTLARSQPIKRVCADPFLVRDHQREVAHVLAPILAMTEDALAERLKMTTRTLTNGTLRTNRFVDLRFDASLDQWQEITRAMESLAYEGDERSLPRRERQFWVNLRQSAVFGLESQRRTYPNHELAAHVVGVVGITNYTVHDTWVRELVGMEGIESTFNKQLSGVRGFRVTEKDRKNHELVRFRGQNAEPVAGLNVVLSLDLVLQKILEAELAEASLKFNPANAMGVIVRPKTGDVLAMANRVTFDPNNLKASTVESRRNSIVNDFYEPGSTFKVISLAAALNEHVTRLSDSYDCEHGSWHYGGLTLTDHEHYNVMPLETVFAKSSNIGIAKMALRMSEPAFYRYIRDFGFGGRTGIELPGEALGKIRDPKYWHKTSMTRIPIGYEVAATPLQMVMAVAAIANGGVLMQPKLVQRLQDHQGRTAVDYPPVKVRSVVSPETVQQVLTAMKTVVSTNGTGVKAMMDDYTVAGKTGTAWKWNNVEKHYEKRYYSSFIGFFPADAPELCIAIILDDPQSGVYGGQVAAPIFKRVAEQAARYFKIPPDKGSLAPRSEDATTLATAVRNSQAARPLR